MTRRLAAAVAMPALALGLGACAYFNGIYNGNEELRKAEHSLSRGDDATAPFRTAAEKAETVLAHYPKTRWRARALYVAGRGHAYGGDCDAATPRLTELLAMPAGVNADERARATVALASCDVRSGRFTAARRELAPLVADRRRDVMTEASLWSARAAIALGDGDAARRDLARVGTSAASWELFAASMDRDEYARAESILVDRGADGDFREDVIPAVRELWRAGRRDAAERVVSGYDRSRLRAPDKARLHVVLAGLQFGAGNDTAAERHLVAVRRYTTDPVVLTEAAGRLLAVHVARAASTADVAAALKADSVAARGSPILAHIVDNLLLVRVLESQRDLSAASIFLAAEVARDSLWSPPLAHALFMRVLRDAAPNSTMPARALLAAADVRPESAAAYQERIAQRYPNTPWAMLLRGGDPTGDPALVESDVTLRNTWTQSLVAFADSMTRRHPRDTTARAMPGRDSVGARP